VKCKLCGDETRRKYILNGSRAKLRIEAHYCSGCSAHFCLTTDYDYHDSDEDVISYYENAKDYIQSRQHKIFSFVRDNFCKQPGVFLDIGSGIGYSLKVAQELGWYAVGVEPNKTLENYSRNVLKLNTANGYLSKNTIETLKELLPEGFADYILVDNVLEHIPDPLDFFQNALSLLKPRGLILVAIPPVDWLRLGLASISSIRQNSTSAQINLFYDPEQHVNYFSRKAIKKLVDKVGGCKLTNFQFHHSKLLNGRIARIMNFETGYYFIVKDAS
jgi:SAM-dependent methyltransferase